MRETISALRAFNVLPDAGGWNDQDADWTDDVFTYLALERRIKWEREHAKEIEALMTGGDGLVANLFGGL